MVRISFLGVSDMSTDIVARITAANAKSYAQSAISTLASATALARINAAKTQPQTGQGVYLPTVGSSPTIAFGAKRIVAGYTGTIITLRRASDSATASFGAISTTNDYLDYNAIGQWLGARSGTVVSMTDQIGSGKTAAAPAQANEPAFDLDQAWAGCCPVVINSDAVSPGPSNRFLNVTGLSISSQNNTVLMALQPYTSFQNCIYWEYNDNASVRYDLVYSSTGALGISSQVQYGVATALRTNPVVMGKISTASGTTFLANEVATSSATVPTPYTMTNLSFGRSVVAGTSASYYGDYRAWAMVVYPTLSTADATTVNASLAKAFGVRQSGWRGRWVIDGDSGENAPFNNVNYCKNIGYYLSLALPDNIEIFNVAVFGKTFAAMQNGASTTITPLYTSTYGAGRCVLTCHAGSNDIGAGTTLSALETIATTYVSTALAAGYQVGLTTVIPRIDFTVGGAYDLERLAYNAWLTGGNSGASAVIDVASLPEVGTPLAWVANPNYWASDDVHLSTQGNQLEAMKAYYPAAISWGFGA